MNRESVDYKVELVAQAIHEAEPQACQWEDEPASCKERIREYARNAIELLNDDIDVLIHALKEAAAEPRKQHPTAAA